MMIAQETKIITVHEDEQGEELCLRIEEDEVVGGILNLCWLNERETEKLINELTKAKERMKEKRERIEKIINTTYFNRLYGEFEDKYNPYPVQMSRAEAFGRARSEGLIDDYTYYAARRYYGRLWEYVGD